MVWKPILDFLASYLKDKPFTDALMVILIGVFIWSESNHGRRTDRAHDTMREVMQERDEANERNTDRIISALTGVKQEVKKLPERTAAETAKVVKDNPSTDPPGI